MKNVLLARLKNNIEIPIIKPESYNNAMLLAETLNNKGVSIIEVSMRGSDPLKLLSGISKKYPNILLLASSVSSTEEALKTKESGANTIISSHTDHEMITFCKKNDINLIPGIMNSEQVDKVTIEGFNIIKFFPTEESCGTSFFMISEKLVRALKLKSKINKRYHNIAHYINVKLITCIAGSSTIS
ncbi:hypothetical protein ACQKPX_22915 [Photobacterium sp. DNB23_23_1]